MNWWITEIVVNYLSDWSMVSGSHTDHRICKVFLLIFHKYSPPQSTDLNLLSNYKVEWVLHLTLSVTKTSLEIRFPPTMPAHVPIQVLINTVVKAEALSFQMTDMFTWSETWIPQTSTLNKLHPDVVKKQN